MEPFPFIAMHLDAASHVYLLLVTPFMAMRRFCELLETVGLLFYIDLHLYRCSVSSTFHKPSK